MKWIDYARADSVEKAIDLIGSGEARALAGGTDLLVNLRVRRLQPDLVVDVKGIPELNQLTYNQSNGLT